MASVAWDSGVPNSNVKADGYNERPPKNVIRSEVDVGVAKTRRIHSGRGWIVTASYDWTPEQYATFITWAQTSLAEGANRISNWLRPLDGQTYEARLVNGMEGVQAARLPHVVRVTLTLEVFGI